MFTQTQGPVKARVDLEVNLRIKVEVEVKAKVEVKVKVEIKVETGDLCLQMKVVCIGFHSLAVFILRICIKFFSSGEKMQEEEDFSFTCCYTSLEELAAVCRAICD